MTFPASCVDRPRANFLLAGAVRTIGTTGARMLAVQPLGRLTTKTQRARRRTKEKRAGVEESSNEHHFLLYWHFFVRLGVLRDFVVRISRGSGGSLTRGY